MLEIAHAREALPAVDIGSHLGPERGDDAATRPEHWLAAVLDEVDYGIFLVDHELRLIHVNDAARAELDATHPLQMQGSMLRARQAQDMARLVQAIHDATRRGLRKQLALGSEACRIGVSIVPLRGPRDGAGSMVAVMMGKHRGADTLSIHGFASSHGLTAAEAQVLAGLCRGASPIQIAAHAGVAISTVRTQICSIRLKTGASSVRCLLHRVAALPPLMGVLRGGDGYRAAPRFDA